MAKTQFEKIMRNVSISDSPKKNVERTYRRSWQFEVAIPANETPKLRHFMQLELEYYNWLLTGLSSRMRTTPESLLEAVDEVEKLFSLSASTGISLYMCSIKTDMPLPEPFEKHRDFIFGLDEAGNRKFTDRIALLCQLAAERAPIHQEVRRRIALEMLSFFRMQVKISLQSVPMHLRHEQAYKNPPASLSPMDIIQKRHLQIPKDIVDVKWNEEEECSYFRIPYLSAPIKVPSINYTEEKNWNYCILHQAPGCIAVGKTPWVFDIRHMQGNYLLKYSDVRQVSSAFYQARRGRVL